MPRRDIGKEQPTGLRHFVDFIAR